VVQSFALTDIGEQVWPIILVSAHSGDYYDKKFLAQTQLGLDVLRGGEDFAVDQLLLPASLEGVPLLSCLWPRIYVDVNRGPRELDPDMFVPPVPVNLDSQTPKVLAGYGVMARVIRPNHEIYYQKLPFSEALIRLHKVYLPYHRMLRRLIQATIKKFGTCLILDCHSTPSLSAPASPIQPIDHDVVISHMKKAVRTEAISQTSLDFFKKRGMRAGHNNPYVSSYIESHYSRPDQNIHCLYVAINRRIYMDEEKLHLTSEAEEVKSLLRDFVGVVGRDLV